MSAPDTHIETQKAKHKGPLIGMGLGLVFALGLLAALVIYIVDDAGVPEGAAVQIDGRTGAAEAVDE